MRILRSKWDWGLALLAALMVVMLAGCAGGYVLPGAGETPKPPAGCEKSVLWSQGFMPLGPGLIVTAVATALIAEPQARPAILLGCVTAYRVVGEGSLAQVTGALAGNSVIKFMVPVLTLLDQWAKAGAAPGMEAQLDACDRQILKDLVRDVALSAGANPGDFQ